MLGLAQARSNYSFMDKLMVVLFVIVLSAVVCRYTAAQGGCNTLSSANALIVGSGKTGVIPNLQAWSGGRSIILKCI